MITHLIDLLQLNQFAFLVIFLVGLIAFMEVGLRIGRLRRTHIGEHSDDGANLVVGSILGLLAFVLALNLSNATTRFEMRMDATLEEVNAVGTAMMQASAVGGEQAEGIITDLKHYLELRYRYIRAIRSTGEIERINAETSDLQNKIWAQLSERINESPTPAVSSLMNALNTTFDSSTALRLAMEYRMPSQLISLLLIMSLLGTAAVGYQFGLSKRNSRTPGIVLSILWCVVVTEIIDIGSARIWSFRTDSRVYEWSLEGLGIPLPTELK